MYYIKAGVINLLFILAILIAFAAISDSGKYFGQSSESHAMILYFVGSLLIVSYSIYRQWVSIVDLLVLYFLSISIGFSGYYQVATEFFPWEVVHDQNSVYVCIVIYIIFGCSYLFGARFAMSKRVCLGTPVGHSPWFKKVIISVMVVAAVCLAASGPALFSPRAGDDQIGGDGITGQMLQIGKSCALTGFLFLFCNWQNNRRYPALTLIASILVLVSYNPVTAPRFQFVAAVIATLATLAPFINMNATLKAIVYLGLFVANYLLFGPLKTFSSGLSNFSFDQIRFAFASIGDYAFRVDFDSLQISANAVTYIKDYGYNFGYQFLGVVFFFVPRAIWSSKPMPTSVIMHNDLGYFYRNLSMPLPMEFFAAGGWLVLTALAFLAGFYIRRVSIRSAASFLRTGLRTDYTVLLALVAGYTPIVMRGALNGVAPFVGFAFVAFVLIVWSTRSQSSVRADNSN